MPKHRAGVRSIAVNATYLVGAHGINSIVRAIYAVALARFLGPESYGFYSYGLNWSLTFLPFAMLGLDVVLSREIGRSRDVAANLVANTLTLRLGVTLVAALVCATAAQVLESVVEAQELLLVFSFALVGRSLATWSNSVFTAYEASSRAFEQESIFRLVEVPLGLAVLFAGGGVLGVAWVHAAIWWIQAVRGILLIHRHLVPIHMGHNFKSMGPIVQYGVPLALANICGSWVLFGPLVVFRYAADNAISLGHLAVVMQVFLVLTGVPFGIGRASLPVLSRAVHREDSREQQFLTIAFRATIVFGTAATLIGMGVGPSLVAALFGESYRDAGALLGPALWLLVPVTFAAASDSILIARGRMMACAMTNFIGALVMTASVVPLVARFEALGILFAAGLGMVAWGATSTILAMQHVDLHMNRSAARPAFAAVLALLAFYTLSGVDVWLAMSLSLIVLFVTAIAAKTLTSEEQADVLRIIRRLLSTRRL